MTNSTSKTARRANQFVFCEVACPVPYAKIFPFARNPNQFTDSRRPVPNRGAFRDRHGRRRRDAVDAGGARDEGAVADGEVVSF